MDGVHKQAFLSKELRKCYLAPTTPHADVTDTFNVILYNQENEFGGSIRAFKIII